jgi:DNA-directed RNA polymerase subunit M/transcription elongation factor TFIIS
MIHYACPHCGEALSVDEAKAGRAYACGLCGQTTTVPDDILHERRLAELKAIQATRHLTAAELDECVLHLRATGRDQAAEQAAASAIRQHERERQAAALAAATTADAPAKAKAPVRRSVGLLAGVTVALVVVGGVFAIGRLSAESAARDSAKPQAAPATPPAAQPAQAPTPRAYTPPPVTYTPPPAPTSALGNRPPGLGTGEQDAPEAPPPARATQAAEEAHQAAPQTRKEEPARSDNAGRPPTPAKASKAWPTPPAGPPTINNWGLLRRGMTRDDVLRFCGPPAKTVVGPEWDPVHGGGDWVHQYYYYERTGGPFEVRFNRDGKFTFAGPPLPDEGQPTEVSP